VVHMVMRVEPAKPTRLFQPAAFRHMHAEMKILVKEIIQTEGGHPAEKNPDVKKITGPQYQRRVQSQNQRRVPPGEPDFLSVLGAGEKIGWTGAKDPMMNQRMGAERIGP